MKNKTQTIRILDIVIIGPTMIYAGATKSNLPTWSKWALVGFGVATIAYNANNYLKNTRK